MLLVLQDISVMFYLFLFYIALNPCTCTLENVVRKASEKLLRIGLTGTFGQFASNLAVLQLRIVCQRFPSKTALLLGRQSSRITVSNTSLPFDASRKSGCEYRRCTRNS